MPTYSNSTNTSFFRYRNLNLSNFHLIYICHKSRSIFHIFFIVYNTISPFFIVNFFSIFFPKKECHKQKVGLTLLFNRTGKPIDLPVRYSYNILFLTDIRFRLNYSLICPLSLYIWIYSSTFSDVIRGAGTLSLISVTSFFPVNTS